LPKSPRQARQPDALPPIIPAGFMEAWEMGLGHSGTYPVYSAPDTASLRGARGRAAVNGKGWVQVFGREGGFVLVQYAIARGHFRIGYVTASAMSEYWDLPQPLDFTRVSAKTLHNTKLTDDPLGQGHPLLSLKAGQEVTLLSKMGGFAYLETKQGKRTARGFAPLEAFDAMPQPAVGLRLASLRTREGEEEVLQKRALAPRLGLSLWYDSQRLSAYEPGDSLSIGPKRIINDDLKSLSIMPGQVAINAYDWQQRYAAGEGINSPVTEDDQPTYPPAPALSELVAHSKAHYTWDGWQLREMGAELANRLPNFPHEAKTGFYAYKGQQVAQVICLDTARGSFVCTIAYPQEAADTWGTRFVYTLNSLELLKMDADL